MNIGRAVYKKNRKRLLNCANTNMEIYKSITGRNDRFKGK